MEDNERGRGEELLESLRHLPDDELVARAKSLAGRERRAAALLVAHLAELDTRDLHLRAGYSSLFGYCRGVLALSEHEAYNRLEVARTARRFPLVLDLLAAGAVNLTTVRLLGPHLTAENHVGVLESARGKKKAEVEEIVARLSPRPDVPVSMHRIPVTQAGGPSEDVSPSAVPPEAAAPVLAASPAASTGSARGLGQAAPAPIPTTAQDRHALRAEVRPLSPGRYKYQLTIGGATLEKLRLARDMLRHALPSGDDEAILDRALTLLLTDLARKKFGSEECARSSGPGATDSRYVPVAVRRAVWVRDRGRCAFVGEGGRRCGERAFVEFHHVHPYAAGGEAIVECIELRCREHNGYEARLFFPPPADRDFVLERIALAGTDVGSTGAGPSARTARSSTPGSQAGGPALGPGALRSGLLGACDRTGIPRDDRPIGRHRAGWERTAAPLDRTVA